MLHDHKVRILFVEHCGLEIFDDEKYYFITNRRNGF